MLTGRKPFDAETMGGLAIRIHSEPLPLATAANPDLPIAVDAWFARACARDIKARFSSAKEMTEELARALGGEVPRSLDGAPRISTGPADRANAVAATLVAGAATDAGVVRTAPDHRARSRLLVLLAIVIILPPTAFFSLRALRARDTTEQGTALVPPDPHAASGGGASSAPTAGAVTPPASAASASATLPPPVDSAVPVAATPKPPLHGTRVRPGASAHVAASTSPLPSPPVTSTATTPRPATSGHDIF
jgi:serine/threonine-protein kinase